ncbi:hypothetical protein F0L68_23280 [Solihabitans fulvus]|uniref:Uncharacterized protein n=1 Tax=Solihabitans fulvus TaxID=1892852 RepID=A0A5B2X6C1_9PSEU|nr:hypothetical protein [Solihabitans fulvus]KAA2258756.1 hypothetical protein F0L68_23280 [Solihabitans fulvus]
MAGDDLSPLERALFKAVAEGRILTCSDLKPAQLADSTEYVIRASVIRDVLRGRYVSNLDPRGLRIQGARVVGQLDLDGMDCPVGIGFYDCLFDEPMSMRHAYLPWLGMGGTHLPELSAELVRVEGNVRLVDGFTATASNDWGAVRLRAARIHGDLDCNGARLTNHAGPALHVQNAHIDGTVFLNNASFTASRVRHATVVLLGAQIGSDLFFRNTRLTNTDGGVVLDLRSASVETLSLPEDIIDSPIQLDGFTYHRLGRSTARWDRWVHWLRDLVPSYSAQPYQQLAAFHRAAGHEAIARRILIAQQDDLAVRGGLSKVARLQHRLKRLIVGYGYQSWRAVIGLAAVITLAIGVGLIAGHTEAAPGRPVATHTDKTVQPRTPCSIVEQVGLGVDRGLPVINTGIRDRCDIDTGSAVGQVLTAAAWLLQLAAWALATLVIAGYTGLIRKTP